MSEVTRVERYLNNPSEYRYYINIKANKAGLGGVVEHASFGYSYSSQVQILQSRLFIINNL